eukprot:tig00000492_g1487.t1
MPWLHFLGCVAMKLDDRVYLYIVAGVGVAGGVAIGLGTSYGMRDKNTKKWSHGMGATLGIIGGIVTMIATAVILAATTESTTPKAKAAAAALASAALYSQL